MSRHHVRGVARAIRRTAHDASSKHHLPQVAIVKRLDPFVVEPTEASYKITEDDLSFGQSVRRYDKDKGIKVGDACVIVPLRNGEWIITEILSHVDPPNDKAVKEPLEKQIAELKGAVETLEDTVEEIEEKVEKLPEEPPEEPEPEGEKPMVFYETHTFGLQGSIVVAGVPGFFVPIHEKETVKLVAAYYTLASGEKVKFKLQRKKWGEAAADVTGFTGLSATTTPTEKVPTGVSLTHKDYLIPVIEAAEGSPVDWACTVTLEKTVTP